MTAAELDDPAVLVRDGVLEDPAPLFDALRRRGPLWRLPGQDAYLVVDPGLIREVVGRPEEFSSNLVRLLHRDGDDMTSFDVAPLGHPIHVLATADPPVHTRHRALLQPHLSRAAVADLEPTIRRIVDDRLAPLLAAGGGDVVAELCDPLPALSLCHLVGLPPGDAARLVPLVAATAALLDGVGDLDGMHRASAAALELGEYAATQLEAAGRRPPAERSGLLAVLVGGFDSGELTPDEGRDILVQLFNAGTETTASLIGNAIATLARTPDLQEQLRREPERIPGALDDVLRRDGPFQFHYRWTTTGVVLGDARIPAHCSVLLCWAAANRPAPTAPDHPDGDGTPATPGAHFAFGRGIHFCIGAPLARLESRIALEELLAGTARFSLDADHPPTRRRSIFLRRHTSLPVLVERA